MTGLTEVPLSALEHYEYCPRQCALIHVDGLWADNRFTVAGQHGHKRVDSGDHRLERGRKVLRSIPLWSETLGLSGRADVVELWPDGTLRPVEYKVGGRHGRTADIQLCAQAMCLEEMVDTTVPEGFIWYSQARRRHRVTFDAILRDETKRAIASVRSMLLSGNLPPPVADGRCQHCQLAPQCLPDLCCHPEAVTGYLRELMTS